MIIIKEFVENNSNKPPAGRLHYFKHPFVIYDQNLMLYPFLAICILFSGAIYHTLAILIYFGHFVVNLTRCVYKFIWIRSAES